MNAAGTRNQSEDPSCARGHETARDLVGRGRADVAADDVQAQVDAAAHPARGEHLPLIDVKHVPVHMNGRELSFEFIDVLPVRGGVEPVQHAGRG